MVDGDTPLIENGKVVSIIAELLSTKTDMVEKALLYRTVATGRDIIDKQHTEQEASYGRDAFAKVGFELTLSLPGDAVLENSHEDASKHSVKVGSGF